MNAAHYTCHVHSYICSKIYTDFSYRDKRNHGFFEEGVLIQKSVHVHVFGFQKTRYIFKGIINKN